MPVEVQALRRLHAAWLAKVRGMTEINQVSRVLPNAPGEVFEVDRADTGGTEDTVKVDCGPVVINLCERAGGQPDLYVGVEGWIRMEASDDAQAPLQTVGFGTRVGYFRRRSARVEHVYGVHYDMDAGSDGHPVFHGQVGPMERFIATLRSRCHLDAEVDNVVGRLLRNVRTPTAQMDFMSVLTQLCADHLVGSSEGNGAAEVKASFEDVRSACDFLLGAGHMLPRLNAGRAPRCYRSSHWYG